MKKTGIRKETEKELGNEWTGFYIRCKEEYI